MKNSMLYFILENTSLRSLFAFFTAFILGITFIPWFIKKTHEYRLLEKIKVESSILKKQNEKKKNTPTMGGIAIIFSYLIALILCGNLNDVYLLLAILVVVSFGLLGICDDLIKTYTSQKGLGSYSKLYFSIVISFVVVSCLYKFPSTDFIILPFITQNYFFIFPFMFILVGIATITATCHAVNLTDGMDGLAVGCSLAVITFFTITMYIITSPILVGILGLSTHLQIRELIVSNFALFGACLAFLWYNTHPAEIFMGDCGALMLGGYIGYIAVASRLEFFLIIVGAIFILETMSSMIQLFSKKFLNRKFFICAPIHHHFRAKGHSESKLVVKFWICQVALVFVAMLAY